MSVTIRDTARRPDPRRQAAVTQLARTMMRDNLAWILVVAAGIAVFHAAIVTAAAIWGNVGGSMWAGVGSIMQWLAFAAGIGFGAWLPVAVAHGVTRRTTAAAATRAILALGAGLAVLVQAVLAVEWAAYRAAGLVYRLDNEHWFDHPGQAHLVLLEHTLLFTGFAASGWLVYLVYYRFGAGRGTLLLPLAMLPAAATIGAVSAGRTPQAGSPAWVGTLGLPAAATLSLLAVGAGLLAVGFAGRAIPIRTK
jgi:hypothetical protein